jgi:hypothetical protein
MDCQELIDKVQSIDFMLEASKGMMLLKIGTTHGWCDAELGEAFVQKTF